MHESEVIEILKSNETFSGADNEVLSGLISDGEVHAFEAGENIVVQGETGKSIWVLLEGELIVLIDEKEVNRVSGKGLIFGEISAVSFTPATATVRSAESSKAISFPHRSLHRAMEKSPSLAASLLRSMAKYLGNT